MINNNPESNKNLNVSFNDKNYIQHRDDGSTVEYTFKNCIFELNDDNGIVEYKDLSHGIIDNALNDEEVDEWSKILQFFRGENAGKKWTKQLKNEIIKMLSDFNQKISNKKIVDETVKDKNNQIIYKKDTSFSGNTYSINTTNYDYENNTEDYTKKTWDQEKTRQISSFKRHTDKNMNKVTTLFDDDNNGVDEKKVVTIDYDLTLTYSDIDEETLKYKTMKLYNSKNMENNAEYEFDQNTGKVTYIKTDKYTVLVNGDSIKIESDGGYFEESTKEDIINDIKPYFDVIEENINSNIKIMYQNQEIK